ncbi:MAG: cyanophycin synthetase [Sporomusaceae bacterium]|nr:cyanophycin synthetase [Sporomusaceae bacterium]
MHILALRSIDGPNIYSYSPVIKATVDIGKYESVSTREIGGFTERLLQCLPSLAKHSCSRGYPGGFVERLREGTYLAHVFEHVAIELQNLAGFSVAFGKTRRTEGAGHYDVVYSYEEKMVGLQAAQLAEALLRFVLAEKRVFGESFVQELKQTAAKYALGPSTQAIIDAAKKRHIPVTQLDGDSLYLLGYGCKQQKIWAALTDQSSAVAVDVACHKELTNRLLAQNLIPVPRGFAVSSWEEATTKAALFTSSVAVKPVNGNQGRGVSLDIRSEAQLRRAYEAAAVYSDTVLIEEYVPGYQYRFCVVGGKVVAAAERLAARVLGDGLHSVRELVAKENENELRGEEHEKPLTKLRLDAVALSTLAKQQLSPDSIPAAGRLVFIRENANISSGGTAVDVTDALHPAFRATVERAVRLIGLDVAGVDVVAKTICQPLEGQGAIIEINAAPGLRMHLYPSAGKPRDVAGAIVDMLFADGSQGRIPIAAITGTNGKTTVTRLVSHILSRQGFTVGMTSTDGIFIGNTCIQEGDRSGPASASVVLRDPLTQIAVLETARGGILRSGLAFDFCDVGVVTNITEDHLGQYGIESLDDMAYIKSLVLERVKPDGTALINADDPQVVAMAKRVKAKCLYFSLSAENVIVRRHLGVGGEAFFVKNDMIYQAKGNEARPVAPIHTIPITLGGAALHNVQNALIAAATAFALGVPLPKIQEGLVSFEKNPGRLTIRQVGAVRICIDYGHNPAGYSALIQTVKQLGAKRLVGVIAAPGDRQDSCILNIGRKAGCGFDKVIIKEDEDLRGRRPGEVAALLRQGMMEGGLTAKQIEVIYSETEAVRAALTQAKAGDLIVIFYEKYRLVDEIVTAYEAEAAADPHSFSGESEPVEQAFT